MANPISLTREYAAGDIALPLTYTATPSTAPRPEALDFKEERGYPDNCQAFVRMDGELWEFKMRYPALPLAMPVRYKGPDIDHMVRQPEGVTMPKGYLAWFLGGLWYDSAEKKLYAPMHVEGLGLNRESPIAPWPCRKIILATSTDKGKTWQDEGDIVTPETYFSIPDAYKFSGSDYSNGLCDFGFFADERTGYFYLFPLEAWVPKGTANCRWTARAARCAMSDKMAPGKWKMFYNGGWDQPGLGGKSSVVAPAMWGVSYSKYLKKYISLFPTNGGTDVPEHYDGIFMGCCSDLAKQDWIWMRCPEAQFGFVNVMNADGTDIGIFDRSMRFYSYFNGNVFQRLDFTFSEGTTHGQNSLPRYGFDPHPESSDRTLGRRTKIVGSQSRDIEYAGGWTEGTDSSSYEGRFKECACNGSMTLNFTGSAVYWRAERSPDSGTADVYLDGSFRKSVDCYSARSTDFEQIVYIAEGLEANAPHVIQVVVHGQRNSASKGTAIRSVGFEFEAESYRASAGFCSISGKNGWRYLEGDDDELHDMRFAGISGRALANYWDGASNEIGQNYQCVTSGRSVREWTAPHDGTVRIQGQAEATTWTDGVSTSIKGDGDTIWQPEMLVANMPRVHDIAVDVHQGEEVSFIVQKENPAHRSDASGDKVLWDPVVTYLKSGPARPATYLPSGTNLAQGRYARSKRLNHAYAPYNAVDGLDSTAFSLSDTDWTAHGGEEWLMVDLERPLVIDRYVIVSSPKDPTWRITGFVIQCSNDGTSWDDIDRGDLRGQDRLEGPVPQFKSRYVRLLIPKGRPFSINEFGLYNTGGKSLQSFESQATVN